MKEITVSEVVAFLDATFHPEYQEDYDNAGFLLGDGSMPYRGCLVALDLTPEVVDEAIALREGAADGPGVNLIVTHHPYIFTGLKRITDRSEAGRMTLALVRHGIAVYAAHTNLDSLPWGVNGILCEVLGLSDCHILRPQAAPAGTAPAGEIGAGMVGELAAPVAADVFLAEVKRLTGQPSIRTSRHDPERRVRRVAVCGGAGAFLIPDAMAARADLFLTADLKYHDFQRAEGRIILADAGHYETEQFAKTIIYRAISEKFSNFVCRISECQQSIVHYI